ncbi:hypothetical protein FC56_GL001352 [Lentilactobacillus senioris DSM 24302 = JCM 17472]|uniref:Coenzyme PQQ synthesis protein D (PqqD) n=1 Tax=Lentilactobacillus senioris DSM 24302 = JCM 17472 TaxID=1423802 RepID=A0A0R2CRH4_9LACO|nr:PqqD family protein [Lentilactobacillus senioris]KRM94398.1 hypothetical protein FC56_GL001352 [Lentilactobacillus senioris DSM 24302 = JCM 17472]
MKRRKKNKQADLITDAELKIMVYKKNPEAHYTVKEGIVTIEKDEDHPIQNFFRKLHFKIPAKSYLELDQYGSFVFLAIDGHTSVYQIGQRLAEQFSEADEYRYSRLIMYLNQIANVNHLVERVK